MFDKESMMELADRFMRAIELRDPQLLDSCIHEDVIFWHNHDGIELSRDDIMEGLKKIASLVHDCKHTERRVNVFEGGYVDRHQYEGVRSDGVHLRFPACVVCDVRDGKIARLDEYIDSVPFQELWK